MSVAFVDTETTGLHPEHDHIWEIAVIVDGVEHVWTQALTSRQRSNVSEWVVQNTRFSTAYQPGEALLPRKSIERFVDLTRGRHLVGAVPSFDSERLHSLWRQYEPNDWAMPWHYHLIDIEALAAGWAAAKGIDVGLPWDPKELSMLVGVDPTDFEPAHSALADARWAKAVYELIIARS